MFSFQFLKSDPISIRLLFSLLVLFMILVARRFLSKWVIKALSHISFNKVRLDPSALSSLQKPINYFLYATGIYVALAVSPFIYYTNSAEQTFLIGTYEVKLSIIPLAFFTKLYLGIIVGTVTWIIYKLEYLYEQFFTDLNAKLSLIDNTVFIRYLSKIINFITLAIGFAVMLTILIPDLSRLVTGVGIGGAAVALVAKDSLASIFSGMFLLLDKPFVIGDWISINDIEGVVEDISFRSTRIRTFSQSLVIIPNNTINNANITNWSRMEKRRVVFDLGVSYDTTPEQIQLCTHEIQSALSLMDEVEKETYQVHFTTFGDYSLNIQIIYYTTATQLADYLAVREKVNLKILELCEAHHIEIAFPTQTILLPTSTPQ